MTQSNADQIAFWNGDAGSKWASGQDRLDAMLADVSTTLIKTASPAKGEHVLDIGCGCGDTAIAVAGLGATVTGIDISKPMLARAKQRAPNLTFLEADAASHRFTPEFDLLVSRFGVMFFANPDAAFANMKTALKPGGRLVFACWRSPRENEWVHISMAAIRPHVPQQAQLGPEDPGPFSFADLARVRRILTFAGFDQITIRPVDMAMRLGDTLDEALDHTLSFGPVSRSLTEASPSERENAVRALREAYTPFATRKPFTLGGAIWIVSAKA